MSAATATRQIIVTEMKLVWRDPAGIFLPLALPLLIIVMNGLTSGGATIGDGIPAVSAIGIPVGFATIVTILALVNMPSFLAAYRNQGVLRRLAVTPARPGMVLLAQVIVNVVLGLVGLVIALVVVAVSFELVAPRLLVWTLVSAALLTAAMYGLGLVISALAPSSSAATAIGLVAFLAMLTLGGGAVPAEVLPPVLADIGGWLPFGAGIQALQAAWIGQVPAAASLIAMTTVALASTLIAVRVFRWE